MVNGIPTRVRFVIDAAYSRWWAHELLGNIWIDVNKPGESPQIGTRVKLTKVWRNEVGQVFKVNNP